MHESDQVNRQGCLHWFHRLCLESVGSSMQTVNLYTRAICLTHLFPQLNSGKWSFPQYRDTNNLGGFRKRDHATKVSCCNAHETSEPFSDAAGKHKVLGGQTRPIVRQQRADHQQPSPIRSPTFSPTEGPSAHLPNRSLAVFPNMHHPLLDSTNPSITSWQTPCVFRPQRCARQQPFARGRT